MRLNRFSKTSVLFATVFLFLACSNSADKAASDAASGEETQNAAVAQQDENRGTTMAKFGDAAVSITYGRPKLKGRDMLGKAGDGFVWRMGMNEVTEIKTDADLHFSGTVVPKGHYSLYMKKVSGDDWQLLFNKQTGQWGTDHDEKQDMAAVPMKFLMSPDTVEVFTVELAAKNDKEGTLKAMWGTAVATIEFKVGNKK